MLASTVIIRGQLRRISADQSSIRTMLSDLLLEHHSLVCDQSIELLLGDGRTIQISKLHVVLKCLVLGLLLGSLHRGLGQSLGQGHRPHVFTATRVISDIGIELMLLGWSILNCIQVLSL